MVALALAHEGESASTSGDLQGQDLKYREALRELLEAEKTQAMKADARYLLGMVYFLGFARYTEAESQLTKAIAQRKLERDEEYPEAENLMGNVLMSAGRPKDAIAYFERARTNLLYATPYFAEMGLGDAYFRLGRHDDAVRHLNRALVAQPDLCGAYVKLAEVHVVRGDEAQVQQSLTNFLERCDSERLRAAAGPRLLGPAYFQMARSKIRAGDPAGASAVLQTCAERFSAQDIGEQCKKELAALQGG